MTEEFIMNGQDFEPTVSNPIEPVVRWISVKERLPEEPTAYDQMFCDCWADGYRNTDVNFKDGEFHSVMEDYQGDFSHLEKIENVTHWMIVSEPSN